METFEIWGKMLGGGDDEDTKDVKKRRPNPKPVSKKKFKPRSDKYDVVVDIDTPNIDDLQRGISQLGFMGPVGGLI